MKPLLLGLLLVGCSSRSEHQGPSAPRPDATRPNATRPDTAPGTLIGTQIGERFGTAAVDVTHPVTGNVRTKVYHWFTCKQARCADCTTHFTWFDGARAAGYRPHRACVGSRGSGEGQ